MFKKYILFLGFILFSTNLFAAQTQIAQEIKSSKACQLTLSRNGNFTRGDDC